MDKAKYEKWTKTSWTKSFSRYEDVLTKRYFEPRYLNGRFVVVTFFAARFWQLSLDRNSLHRLNTEATIHNL